MFLALGLVRRLVGLLVLVAVLVLGGTATAVWWVAREDSRPRSDAIVVLGASQYNGVPSAVFRARLLHAKDLYDAGVAPRVVTVGGGAPGDRYTEAEAGARFLTEHGVKAVAVARGRDTLQSMRAVAAEFRGRDWSSAVLVTDPWHELRSRRMASDLGITAATSPVRTGPAVHSRVTELRYIVRESLGYLYYRVFHRSSDSGTEAV